jgi:hypothetical protein
MDFIDEEDITIETKPICRKVKKNPGVDRFADNSKQGSASKMNS